MLDSNSIQKLFENVLNQDITRYGIGQYDIRRAVRKMAQVYAPDPTRLRMTSVDVANYNDAGHRCAYLYKYAAFHTAMVQDLMVKILEQHRTLFRTIITSEEFKICSLGGGPGSDVIGVIAALNTHLGAFRINVTIVDLMEQWKYTFASLVSELSSGDYGTAIRTNVADNFLQWKYIGSNLLDGLTYPVKAAVSQASLVTLIKFVSAAACQDTEEMVDVSHFISFIIVVRICI